MLQLPGCRRPRDGWFILAGKSRCLLANITALGYNDKIMSLSILPILHQPLIPPRADLALERFFAEQWRLLMASEIESEHADITPLGAILYPLTDTPDQRQAALAASFVTWLGTNCGQSFLIQADRLAGDLGSQHGYLAAWAIQNHRRHAVNSGLRTIEHLAQLAAGGRLPNLTLDDAEVIEHVVAWLATDEGQGFLADCRRQQATAARVSPWAPEHPKSTPGPYDW